MDRPLSAPPNWDDPPDNDAAERAVTFMRNIPQTKSGWQVDESNTLGDSWLDWQDKLTRHLFGTLNDDDSRQYEVVYVEMPKKSGKSTYLAGVVLACLTLDQQYGSEAYSAAYNEKQAKVVWNIARDMIELDREHPAHGKLGLADRLEVKDYRNEILYPATNSIYEPLTKGSVGKHGFNPNIVALDELHEQPDRELWDTIEDSMTAREQPLLFAITNAGHDRQSICYQQRQYAMKVNDPDSPVEDDTFLGVVYGADPEDDDWTEPETWRRANPGLGTTVPVERVAKKCEKAKEVPSAQNAFKRWQCGIWTRQDTKWIAPRDWAECREDFTEEELEGQKCFGGIDLGSVSDLTSLVWAFPDPQDPEVVRFLARTWCPEARVHDRTNVYRDQYREWTTTGPERGGVWLETCEGAVMDYAPLQQQVLADVERFDVQDIAVDAQFQGSQLMIDLIKRHGLEAVAMKTTYNDMTSPCDELERRMRAETPKIRHRGNPVLTWAIQNVALRRANRDPDLKRPVKDSDDAKIDPVVALLMALDRAMRHEDVGSPYEDNDMLVL